METNMDSQNSSRDCPDCTEHPSRYLAFCWFIHQYWPCFEGNGWQEFMAKADLKHTCTEEVGHHFMQASDTSFLTDPLLHLFGETGHSSSNFRKVLSGEFKPLSMCDPYATLLLCHLYWPAHVVDLPHWSLEEYSMSWRKAQETTSSSPLGYILATIWLECSTLRSSFSMEQ